MVVEKVKSSNWLSFDVARWLYCPLFSSHSMPFAPWLHAMVVGLYSGAVMCVQVLSCQYHMLFTWANELGPMQRMHKH